MVIVEGEIKISHLCIAGSSSRDPAATEKVAESGLKVAGHVADKKVNGE
jgi:hypothetical protein